MAIPIRDSVLTAVPAEPDSAKRQRAASDIPPLAEDIGPEPAPTLDLSLDVLWTRVETGDCSGAGAAAQLTCNASADIWSFWTRWRRNF